MTSKAITQSTLTKNFISSVRQLVDTGVVKNAGDLADKLNWNKSTMSEVITGKRNVARHIALRLDSIIPVLAPQNQGPVPSPHLIGVLSIIGRMTQLINSNPVDQKLKAELNILLGSAAVEISKML